MPYIILFLLFLLFPVSVSAQTPPSCLYKDGGSLAHTTSNLNAGYLNGSTCISVNALCTSGTFSSGGVDIVTGNTYSSLAACQSVQNACGGWSSGPGQTSYFSGIYVDQMPDLLNQFAGSLGLCAGGGTHTTPQVVGGSHTWTCTVSNVPLSCNTTVRPAQPVACAGQGSSYQSISGNNALCTAGAGHTDPTITSNIKAIAGQGGGTTSRSRTCAGKYHTSLSCSAPSRGQCGTSHNQPILSLNASSAGLCTNGISSGFALAPYPIVNDPAYDGQYTRSCLGSQASLYDSCIAPKAKEPTPGVCHASYHNKNLTIDQIRVGTLCAVSGAPQGQSIPSSLTFSAAPTNNTRTRTCPGIGNASGASCSASMSVNGQCSINTTPVATQPAVSSLCPAGQASAVTIANGAYKRTCDGINGGIAAPGQCSAPCAGGVCSVSNTTGTTTSTPSTITNTGTLGVTGIIISSGNIISGTMISSNATNIDVSLTTSGTIRRVGTREMTATIRGLAGVATGVAVDIYIPAGMTMTSRYGYTIYTGDMPLVSAQGTRIMRFSLGQVVAGQSLVIPMMITSTLPLTTKTVSLIAYITSPTSEISLLDNSHALSLVFDADSLSGTGTSLGSYLVNPLLILQNYTKRYALIDQRYDLNYTYNDFSASNDLYIPLRTMTRQGIMRGYPSEYGYVIKPSQCVSRVDLLTALSKVVYILGSTDVYKSRQEGSSFVDMQTAPSDVLTAINRGYERGLTQSFSPKKFAGSTYLEPSTRITSTQLVGVLTTLYKRYGFDETMITDYIQNSDMSDTCVRRDSLADVLMTMIGHHPSVLIGDNDTFLRLVQDRIIAQPIITRRESITNIITKLGQTDAETLRTRGYDMETLVAILTESLQGVTRTGTFRLE